MGKKRCAQCIYGEPSDGDGSHVRSGSPGKRIHRRMARYWHALQKLEAGELERETREWASEITPKETEGWSIDGKVLRGSRREDPQQAAVQVVTMVAQTLKRVMSQQIAEGGDQTEATLELLKAVPLQGKLVTLDAGLLHREVANTIVAHSGDYLGPIKGNEAQVKNAVDEWIEAKISPPGRPD